MSPLCTCPTTTSITGTVAGSFGGLTIGVILGILISVFVFVCHHRHLCGVKRELYIVLIMKLVYMLKTSFNIKRFILLI